MQAGNALPDSSTNCPFTVAVGYEDYASGLRAIELYQRLVAQWGEFMEFRLVIWKFEPLGIPSLLHTASAETAAADLIIVSLSGNHAIPVEAQDWIGHWRGRTGSHTALALILDAQFQSSNHARNIDYYLRTVSEESGIQYFSSYHRDENGQSEAGTASHHSADVLHSLFNTEQYVDHWGINE